MRSFYFVGTVWLVLALLILMSIRTDATTTFMSTSYGLQKCLRLDSDLPYFYLDVDETWKDKEEIRLVLHNNSDCGIILKTLSGKGMKLNKDQGERDGKIGQIMVQYKINSYQQPWAFTTYWPYGDTYFSYLLKGGENIKFLVPRKFLGEKRQIAIEFDYEWEELRWTSGISHSIYSPPNLLRWIQR